MGYRHLFAAVVACASWSMTGVAQTAARRLTVGEASAHSGELATVCGMVVATSCRQNGGGRDLLLALTPPANPNPVRIRIPADQRESFGTRLDERLDRQAVCATGTITRVGPEYQITATEPMALQASSPTPLFAPDLRNACDVGVEVPALMSGTGAGYTADAMRRRIQGSVLLLAVVQSDGTVGEVTVQEPLDPELDEKAMQALRAWTFRPGTFRGKPAPVVISVKMAFSVKK